MNPLFTLFLGVFSVSLSSIITRYASSPAIAIATNRMLFAFLLMTPFTLKQNIKELRAVPKKDLLLSLISGFFLGLHFWSWIASIQRTSIANSTILVSTHPLFIALLLWVFYKNRPALKTWMGIFLALMGMGLMVIGTSQHEVSTSLGNLLAILGAVTVSFYFLIGARLRKTMTTSLYTALAYGSAFITLGILALIMKSAVFTYTPSNVLVYLLLAIIPTFLGHSLFNQVLKVLPADLVSLSILGEPILSIIWAYFLFQESIGLYQLLGGGLILMGIFLRLYKKRAA